MPITSGQEDTSHNRQRLRDGSGNRTAKQELKSPDDADLKLPEGSPINSECSNSAPASGNLNTPCVDLSARHLTSNASDDTEEAIPVQYPLPSPSTANSTMTIERLSTHDSSMRNASSAEQSMYEVSVLACGKELADYFRIIDREFYGRKR